MTDLDPYSDDVRRRFLAPAHAGELDAAVQAGAAGQGMAVQLWLSAEGDRIGELRFRAYGCPHFIAAAEAFCAGWESRPLAELADFSAAALIQSLPVPIEKTGRILVLEDAVRSLNLAVATVGRNG